MPEHDPQKTAVIDAAARLQTVLRRIISDVEGGFLPDPARRYVVQYLKNADRQASEVIRTATQTMTPEVLAQGVLDASYMMGWDVSATWGGDEEEAKAGAAEFAEYLMRFFDFTEKP